MKYNQITGTFKAEPFTEDMLYAQVKYGTGLPRGVYFSSASYDLMPTFKLGHYLVISDASRRPNHEVKLGDMMVTKVGEDKVCDVLPEPMFQSLYNKITEPEPVTDRVFRKLEKLINDMKERPPFGNNAKTVVCMGPDDLDELMAFLKATWGYKGFNEPKVDSFSRCPLPQVMGVMVCDKRRHILIDSVNDRYNIIVMPDEPLGCTCFKARTSDTPEWPLDPLNTTKSADVRFSGAPGRCYYQIVMTKQNLWKIQHELQKLKIAMENNPRGHLNDDDVEMIWDGDTFCLKLFGISEARFPRKP